MFRVMCVHYCQYSLEKDGHTEFIHESIQSNKKKGRTIHLLDDDDNDDINNRYSFFLKPYPSIPAIP